MSHFSRITRQDQSNVRQKYGSRFRRRISVEFNSLNWIRHGRNATYEPGLRGKSGHAFKRANCIKVVETFLSAGFVGPAPSPDNASCIWFTFSALLFTYSLAVIFQKTWTEALESLIYGLCSFSTCRFSWTLNRRTLDLDLFIYFYLMIRDGDWSKWH